ncbi:MAG: hypothetical protein JXM79_06255 [Sedimentisphaerales bacterium]|nr:hypothetical protein [Sedimentisphaerales bacterium]
MEVPTIVVVRIESSLWRSKIIPVMPNISEAGNENKLSNPPRTPIGLPQPGWIRKSARIVNPPKANMVNESVPKRIL